MTRNKHFRSVFAALLCAVLCMTAFATIAYADGGDYYDDELPPETWQEETQPEDTTIAPGTPFTEDGIAATRDLLYDKHTNKQFITVETRNGIRCISSLTTISCWTRKKNAIRHIS